MKFTAAAVVPFLIASQVAAICPGFNYGIGNVQSLGNGINRWTVYDDSCNAVDGLTTNQNPCTEGIFGCTPPPITFNSYTNSFSHLIYACRPDPNSGTCGNDVISVCCRNDGN
ncbi:hypothetical protein M378DRAFT_93899 [Amanita muscaria Koide BX008]|uniref:Uncharacterized protein n=1 Tax=Amanita muscaria (strain Koide BX008) TaxID=946122 RepID=A0A0C2TVL2_AMAMK|nr:hypothetical protein M378DRAFT_65132 [Amanita muscaria Koide BX008]KIL71398.1 hypothetical protein M378DRAFT_93899 [Amanita muscaria Koide BX008]